MTELERTANLALRTEPTVVQARCLTVTASDRALVLAKPDISYAAQRAVDITLDPFVDANHAVGLRQISSRIRRELWSIDPRQWIDDQQRTFWR